MASIFGKIVAGEIPCHRVAETEDFLAFLDIMPLAQGHTLVIPKIEVDRIWDLDADVLGELHVFSQKVALAMGRRHSVSTRWASCDWIGGPTRACPFDPTQRRFGHQFRTSQTARFPRRPGCDVCPHSKGFQQPLALID